MKFLVYALSVLATAFAYPDVSELNGYNYNRPSGSSLGSATQPSGSYLPGSSSNVHHATSPISQPSGSYIPASGSNNYQTSASISQPSGSYIPASGSNNYQTSAPISQPSSSYIPASGSNNFGQSTSPTGSYIPPSGSNNYGQVSQPSGSYLPGGGAGSGSAIQDQKHVYFYAAPDDEGPAHLRINVAANNNKNTKIIFIKAPSSGGIVPEIISPPSQAEDKTLVYVLVKKADQNGQITIPATAGVKQAKPEVYFIKYKNPHDAEKAVSDSLGGHPAGSSLPALNDAQAFVRTIKDTPQHGVGDSLGGGSSPLGSAGFGGNGLGNGGLGNGGLGNGGFGNGGLGSGGLGNGGFGNGGLGSGGLGGSGLGNNGLGSSGSGYNYGPPGGSGPY